MTSSSRALTPPPGSTPIPELEQNEEDGVPAPRIHVAVRSDTGKVRSNNEDCFVVRDDIGVVAVADGVGGHQAGEIASQLACSILEASLELAQATGRLTLDRTVDVVSLAFRTAGRSIVDKADATPDYHGMGTTLVALIIPATGKEAVVAHVGDSRLYRCRGGSLLQITRDHTLYEELVARGKAHKLGSRLAETRNVLTRALGIKRDYEVDIQRVSFYPGDRALLCSDGLSDVVRDDEIAAHLADLARSGQQVVDSLVGLALDRGGPDNVTVAVVTFI